MIDGSTSIMIFDAYHGSRPFGSCVEPWGFSLDGFDPIARAADGMWLLTTAEHAARTPKRSRFKRCAGAIDGGKP